MDGEGREEGIWKAEGKGGEGREQGIWKAEGNGRGR